MSNFILHNNQPPYGYPAYGISIAAATNPGFETLPRFGNFSLAGISGQLWIAYFSPIVTCTITQLMIASGDTAAVSCTLARMGLFSVAPDDSITLVARGASDTTIGATTFTAYERPLNATGGYPTSYTLFSGNRYAVGFLQVASTPMTIQGTGILDGGIPPVGCRIITGQSDILTSYAVGSLTSYFQMPYMRGRP